MGLPALARIVARASVACSRCVGHVSMPASHIPCVHTHALPAPTLLPPLSLCAISLCTCDGFPLEDRALMPCSHPPSTSTVFTAPIYNSTDGAREVRCKMSRGFEAVSEGSESDTRWLSEHTMPAALEGGDLEDGDETLHTHPDTKALASAMLDTDLPAPFRGQFQPIKNLGQGNFGTCWLVQDTKNNHSESVMLSTACWLTAMILRSAAFPPSPHPEPSPLVNDALNCCATSPVCARVDRCRQACGEADFHWRNGTRG